MLAENRDKFFAITDTKRHVSVETLSANGNVKLLDLLKSGFKRTIIGNKYLGINNPYSDYLIDLSFQGVYRLFVLLFLDI